MSFLGGALGNIAGALGTGSIGRASVALALDDSKYNAQLAEDEAKTKGATGGMAKTTAGASAAMSTAYAAAGLAAAEFAKSSVEAAIEQQIATDKLVNSIVNSSKVSVDSIDAFNKQANSLRDLTGISDEAVTSSQALQVQMGLTADQVSALTPLIVDLSVKQGIDLQTATKAVGKAVNGSSGALGRLGVIIDKTAFATDHYGTVLKGLGAAQGFAAQKADTEPWVKLSAQFHELEETVGKGLLPVLQNLGAGLDLLTHGKLPDATAAITGLELASRAFGTNLPILGSALQAVGQDTSGFQADMATLQTQIEDGTVSVQDAADKVYALALAHGYGSTKARELADQTAALYKTQIAQSVAADKAQAADQRLADAHHNAAVKAREQKAAEDALAGGELGLITALQSLQTDQATINDLRKKGKTDSQAYSAAVLQELQDQNSLDSSLQDLKNSMRAAGEGGNVFRSVLNALGREAGLSKGDLATMLDSFNQKLDESHGKVTSLRDLINQLPTKKNIDVTVTTHLTGPGGGIFQKQLT
jgi:hypothetical protein